MTDVDRPVALGLRQTTRPLARRSRLNGGVSCWSRASRLAPLSADRPNEFSSIFDAATRQGPKVSDSGHASNYAPRMLAEPPKAERYRVKDFAAAMERLFAEVKIRKEEHGRKREARSRIVRVVEVPGNET